MSSEELKELEQGSLGDLVLPSQDHSPISPSRFKSLVSNLRQKLHHDVALPLQVSEIDSALQQTKDDVACLSRLLCISEASLAEERKSSQAARDVIQNLQQQLQSVSDDATADRATALQIKSEFERSQQNCSELQSDVNVLRDALCKSEAYRKEYAKSKKSELLDLQTRLDAAASEATAQQEAHQRTHALLLSEVEKRTDSANAMQRLEASFAELQLQHQNVQDLCRAQKKELEVSLSVLFHPNCAISCPCQDTAASLQGHRHQQARLQDLLHAARCAADTASQQAAKTAALEEQLRTQTSDANDLLSVMTGMRETLSQQQHAITKLVAKRARAEERATAAEERCQEANAQVEQQLQLVKGLQVQLHDSFLSLQLHQAVSERVGSDACTLQTAHQLQIQDIIEAHRLQLQQLDEMAAASEERSRCALDALRSAHAIELQQLQAAHEHGLKFLQTNVEQEQQRTRQLKDDLIQAQADAMDLLQKCDTLRQSISDDAAASRSKLSLAAAAASQSHSEMVAAQEARAVAEDAITAIGAQNKSLLSQINELGATLASLRAELEQQQQRTSDAAASARASGIAQQIAESELLLEKEATVLHRLRADSAEKLLEESARMRADVQVVLAAASDELADALETSLGGSGDASTGYSACVALLCMLRHTRPVLVDPSRHDKAIDALQEICAASAAQAGKKVAAMAAAAADAMREADELRNRCSEQQQQLQAYLAQSLEAAAVSEQLQQMHARVDAMAMALDEGQKHHQLIVEENKQLELLRAKAASEASCALQQHDKDSAELMRLHRNLQDLQDTNAASSDEISRLSASIAAANLQSHTQEANAAAAQAQASMLGTMCADLRAKLDLTIQETAASAEAAAAAEQAAVAALTSHFQVERSRLISESKCLAADVENLRLALQAAEQRLQDQEKSAATELVNAQATIADANSRVAELSQGVSDLQLELRDAQECVATTNEEKKSSAVTLVQLEADHAQLLRDCELLHAYQSQTLQELQQLQAMYDQLVAERDEADAAAAAHDEEQEQRLQEAIEAAAAAESERAQLLQHLHLSHQENLQLHRQQQLDEREKLSLQSAVTAQNEALQQEAAAKAQQLEVPFQLNEFTCSCVHKADLICRRKLKRCALRTLSC